MPRFFIPHNNNECIVYLDRLKKLDSGSFDVYIDFRLEKDLNMFINSNIMNQSFDIHKTYIELRFLRTNKRLISGCYYKLNLDVINSITPIKNNESLVINCSYDLATIPLPQNDSQEVLQAHEILNPNELLSNSQTNNLPIPSLPNFNLTLITRNVGQANWNEIWIGNTMQWIYDIGASLHASRHEVERTLNLRKRTLQRDKPILVLSHWDIDHFHCLSCMDKVDIKNSFSKFVCMDAMKSITSKRTYNTIITALGYKNVYCLKPVNRTNGISMHLWNRCGNIAFYVGEKNRNINYCALCLFVSGAYKSSNLTGDIRLIQAKDIYDREIKKQLSTSKHVLIAPHHGGDNKKCFRRYSSPTNEVVISVGYNNDYNHPSPHMLSYLNRLCNNNIKRTDQDGDITISL